MYAKNGSVRLYYEVRGAADAPPLLMLRGLARTVRHWGKLLDELGDRFALIVMDNRGAGRSDAPFPPYTTAVMADDAAAVLDHAGVARTAVFGVSLGGMIAQELCLRHEARVSRLVLGCTRAGGRSGRPPSAGSLLGLLGAIVLPEARALERSAPMIVSETFLAENPGVIADWQRIAREQPMRRRGFVGQLLAAIGHDTSRRLKNIRIPTLVVSGDADKLIHVDNSRHLATAIPGALLELLPGAGHDIPLERPRELAQLITQCASA